MTTMIIAYLQANPLIRGFAVLLLAIGIQACGHSMDEVRETVARYEPATETGRNITLNYFEDGIHKARLTAPVIVSHKAQEPYMEFPEGLNMRFFDANKRETGTLSARYAIRNEKKRETIFRDSVVVRNEKNEELFTEEMIWDEDNAIIYSDKFVRIVTPEERITGRGFEADQEFKSYTIKNITGQVYVESN